MSLQYPTPEDSGTPIRTFVTEGGWSPDSDGRVSAERLASGCAMGVKLAGDMGTHRVACAIIYDGKAYFGRSYHGLSRDALPAKLQSAMRNRSATSYQVSNCAEIEAMAAVVEAGFDPEQFGAGLEVHACRTDTGRPVAICPNCQMLLVGSTCTSGGTDL